MGSKAILTIDDSLADHILSAHAMMAYDSDVVLYKAMGGEEGLSVLRDHDDIDTILLDLNMPGMDGFEFMDAYCDEFGVDAHNIFLMLGTQLTSEQQKVVDECPCIKGAFVKPIDDADLDILFGA